MSCVLLPWRETNTCYTEWHRNDVNDYVYYAEVSCKHGRIWSYEIMGNLIKGSLYALKFRHDFEFSDDAKDACDQVLIELGHTLLTEEQMKKIEVLL